MKKMLPLREPPITSHPLHMYPLAILARDEAYLPWLYDRYIQLFDFPGETLQFFAPGCRAGDAHWYSCPLLDVQRVEQGVLGALSRDSVSWFIDSMTRGYYVQVDVDAFHLPGQAEYQMRHSLHQLLLFGYDDQERIFASPGLDREGRFAVFCLPFGELERAMRVPEGGRETRDCPTWSAEDGLGRPRIALYRYLGGRRCLFDLVSVVEQLEDYLRGRNTSRRFRLVATPREGGVWGMSVYGLLREEIGRLGAAPGDGLPAVLRVLWEHKKIMRGRIEYMERLEYLDPGDGLSTRYGGIEEKANRLRSVMLHRAARSSPIVLEEAQGLLAEIAAAEFGVLEEVLEEARKRSLERDRSGGLAEEVADYQLC